MRVRSDSLEGICWMEISRLKLGLEGLWSSKVEDVRREGYRVIGRGRG